MKRSILLQLLVDMKKAVTDKDVQQSLENLGDTVVHTAPEMLDQRWNSVYLLCVTYMNDDTEEHRKCFNLYQDAFRRYKAIVDDTKDVRPIVST